MGVWETGGLLGLALGAALWGEDRNRRWGQKRRPRDQISFSCLLSSDSQTGRVIPHHDHFEEESFPDYSSKVEGC